MLGVTGPSPVHAIIKACPELTEMGATLKLPITVPVGAGIAPVVLSYAIA
jgi:hypothetical protein